MLALGLCLLISILVSLLLPPVYQSNASVLVNKFSREFTYRPDIVASALPIQMASDPDEILNTQVQLLLSRNVILGAIDRVGAKRLFPSLVPDDEPPNLDRLVEEFAAVLSIVPQRTSNVLHLSFQHRRGEVAAAALETLIQVFREKSIEVYVNAQTPFYESQVAAGRQKFEAASARLIEYRRRYGAQAFDGQMALLLQQRIDLDSEAKRAAADLAAAERRVVELRRQIGSTGQEVTAYVDRQQSRVVEDARAKLLNLLLREQELRVQFADESRQMQQVEKEIAVVRDFLAQEGGRFAGTVRTARNDILTGVEQELNRTLAESAALAGRQANIATQIDEVDARIAAMSDRETERWSLEREVATAQEGLKLLMAKLEEARASESLSRERAGNISIVQTPSLPDPRQPVRPKPLENILLGLLAGAFLGLVVALLSEFLSDTIYEADRTERLLGIPTLAVFNLADRDGSLG